MSEELDKIKGAVAAGLSQKETEALLGRTLSEEEANEFVKIKAQFKIKTAIDKQKQEEKKLQAPTSGVTNALKPKLPAVKDRYTKEQVEDCIERHLGIVTSICNDLDCTYTQFYRAVKHWQLDGAIEEARKTIVAEAEGALLQALRSQDERVRLDAAKYTLARLGKDNGWSENPNVAVAVQVSPGEKQAQIMAIFGLKDDEPSST